MKSFLISTKCAKCAKIFTHFFAHFAHFVDKKNNFSKNNAHKFKLSLLFILSLPLFVVQADVKTVSGNINFDVSSDSTYEMKLTSEGLQVGTGSTTYKLEIGGNLISDNLYIGQTGGNSSLSLKGTMGFGIETVSANTTLSGNTIILVDTSSDNIFLTLPDAQMVTGRIYKIKKTAQSNYVRLGGGGNIDGNPYYYMYDSTKASPYIEVLASSDNIWNVMSQTDGVTPVVGWSNLIGWWKLDETSGSSASDSSQFSHTGTLYNFTFDTSSISGNVGNALEFDGSNDRIEITGTSDLDTPASMTVTYWVYDYSTGGDSHTVSKDSESGTSRVWTSGVGASSTQAAWTTWNSGDTLNNWNSLASSWEEDNWIFMAYTSYVRNGTIYKAIYKNGSLVGTTTFSGTAHKTKTTQKMYMCFRAVGGTYKKAKLDDVRYYNNVLSAEEIQDLYQLGQ